MDDMLNHHFNFDGTVNGGSTSSVARLASPETCNRPLSKSELLELLAMEEIELELMVALELLTPSKFMEYHNHRYLGFINFWDCLRLKVYQLVTHATKGVFRSDGIASTVADDLLETISELPPPFLSATVSLQMIIQQAFDQSDVDLALSYRAQNELCVSLMEWIQLMFRRLERLTFSEEETYYSPYSVNFARSDVAPCA